MRVMSNPYCQPYFKQHTKATSLCPPQFGCHPGTQIQQRIILVVDDEAEKREMIQDYLEDIPNLKVLFAKNIEEAKSHIKTYTNYPLFRVYLDNQIGIGKTGAAFADELLQKDMLLQKPTLRPEQIVMISADDKEEFAAELPRVQALEHCRKGPGFLQKLVKSLETITTAKT